MQPQFRFQKQKAVWKQIKHFFPMQPQFRFQKQKAVVEADKTSFLNATAI